MNEQQVLELELNNKVIDLLLSDLESGKKTLINELQESSQLVQFFQNYMSDRWEVNFVFIHNLVYRKDSFQGSFDVECSTVYYLGCRDIDKPGEYLASLNFKVDMQSSTIVITGEPIPEPRSTFEEF